jgi:primosomal protein N' (replication factor Y)
VAPAVARVLPEVAALDKVFDYAIASDEPAVHVGDRVRVNLNGRSVRGWVVGLADDTDVEGLKPIARRLGQGPPASVVTLCQWAAWRWAGPWSKLLASASPPRIVIDPAPAPPRGAMPDVHNQVRVAGLRLVRRRESTLVEVGPCTDPIDLILGVLHGVDETETPGSVVVTTPTTGWANRLAERLRHRGVAAAGPEQWSAAAAGWPVVVGTRATSFAPVPALASAIVLDAHDGAYRQTQTPCWNAVTVLAERCNREGVSFVATSWCADPTLRALVAHHDVVEHEQRLWPRLVVADLSVADPRERQLSGTFVDAARRALDEPADGVRVAVVLQRLGGARLLACKACGALAVCEAHAAAIREVDGGYGCAHGCRALPKLCVACGSPKLVVLREGITTLAKRVSALLGVDAVEVSAAKDSIPDGARVVVGTEAVLSRVRHAGVVCFADVDDYLCAPRAHASLEALRAIGLAGRLVGARGGSAPGLVVVQTRQALHPAVTAAVNGAPGALLRAEEETARSLGLPPHVAMCALRGDAAAAYAAALPAKGITVTDMGDHVVVSAADHATLCDALSATPRPPGALRVEVDPPDG